MSRLSAAALALFVLLLPVQAQHRPARVMLVSIDGLMPADYLDARSPAPNLRALAANGAFAEGVISTLPSVTFAAHTTLITGVQPAVHGILDNRMVDPEGVSNDAWYWYARDIQVATLPGVTRAAGLRAASVWWPATVGMPLDALVPEFWRSMHPETLSLIRALSSPRGLLDDVEDRRQRPFALPITDRDKTDLALHVLRTTDPHLLMIHLGDLDSARHTYGPDATEAREALRRVDGYIGELLAAVRAAGRTEQTTVAIVSDHGFLPLRTALQPNAAFRKAGLLTTDASGRVTAWQAYFHSSGGSGFIYVKDAAVLPRARDVLTKLRKDPANGIRTIWTAEELERRGAHPEAAFGLDVVDGFYTGGGHDALLRPEPLRGGHGFDPERPAMHAGLILAGAAVHRDGSLGIISMTRVAPTLARILGVSLPAPAAAPLSLQ